MKVFALWHGGSSYSQGSLEKYLETFDSLKAVKEELRDRYDGKAYQTWASGQTPNWCYTPTVSDNSSFWVWIEDPRDMDDPYPDRIVSFGPKMGVRIERA